MFTFTKKQVDVAFALFSYIENCTCIPSETFLFLEITMGNSKPISSPRYVGADVCFASVRPVMHISRAAIQRMQHAIKFCESRRSIKRACSQSILQSFIRGIFEEKRIVASHVRAKNDPLRERCVLKQCICVD